MQMTLIDDPLDVRFAEFHDANPHVYDALVRMARRWRATGRNRCSIAMLTEVLRWEIGITTTGDPFILNNSYRSRYARLIEASEPDLAGIFETRSLRGDWCMP
jgi:hypothetical protein